MDAEHACDESKCVSTGFPAIEGHFGCYYQRNREHTKKCSDGFLPVIINDDDNNPLIEGYRYHTCCPPSIDSNRSTTIARHCSDPIVVDEHDDYAATCETRDDIRRYPRPLKSIENSSEIIAAIICCDTNRTNTMNFLDEVECVPYKDDSKFRDAEVSENLVGLLDAMVCDVDGFPYPRPIDNGDFPFERNDGTRYWPYECCQDGPAVHFRFDSSFEITVFPALVLFFFSAIASMIIATALLVPLLIQPKNGTPEQQLSRVSRRRSSFGTRASFSIQTQRAGRSHGTYSTYNLYIIALALADFLYCIFQLVLYGSAIDQRFNPYFYGSFINGKIMIGDDFIGMSADYTIAMAYFFANIYINAIVAYQVLELLRSSQQHQRILQPSQTKAIREIGLVYFFSTVFGVGLYFLYDERIKANNAGNIERGTAFHVTALILMFTMLLPIFYVLCVAVLIKYRRLIPPSDDASANNKAVRGLSLYLFRILAVFYGIYLPAIAMNCVIELSTLSSHAMYLQSIAFWLLGLQPLLSAGMVLTKDDVRKYVWDLVTLAYARKDKEASFDDALCGSRENDDTGPTAGGLFGSSKNRSGKSIRFGDVSGKTDQLLEIDEVIDDHTKI